MSSPSFDSLAEPQHGHVSGTGMTTRSRQMIGKRLSRRAVALKGFD
jgi:hypothetical protein